MSSVSARGYRLPAVVWYVSSVKDAVLLTGEVWNCFVVTRRCRVSGKHHCHNCYYGIAVQRCLSTFVTQTGCYSGEERPRFSLPLGVSVAGASLLALSIPLPRFGSCWSTTKPFSVAETMPQRRLLAILTMVKRGARCMWQTGPCCPAIVATDMPLVS